MIKKIIIIGLIVYAMFLFYKKFMADTMQTYFKLHTRKVDFFQAQNTNPEIKK